LCLGKKSSRAEITSQEKRNRVFTVGFQEEAEKNQKAAKLKEDGLLVEPAEIKEAQNHVVGLMLLKEQKEDVGRLVLLVRHINEGRVNNEMERFY